MSNRSTGAKFIWRWTRQNHQPYREPRLFETSAIDSDIDVRMASDDSLFDARVF